VRHTKLWVGLGLVAVLSFSILGYYGREIYHQAPPIPERNVGLALMVLISLLPIGLLQTWAGVDHGLWYARSAEFLHTDVMQTLRWLRIVGDTVFAVGTLALGWFILGLKTGGSLRTESLEVEPARSKVA